MDIKLVPQIPVIDGYYLMKFNPSGNLHLVSIRKNDNGARVLVPINFNKLKNIEISLNEAHANVFKEAVFSEVVTIIL